MAVEEPVYENMIQERDVIVKMRDGVHLAVDIYRPKAPGKYPVLYTCAVHNKDLQRPELAEALPLQRHTPLCGTGSSKAATPSA
jgi:predicted acyl esterase